MVILITSDPNKTAVINTKMTSLASRSTHIFLITILIVIAGFLRIYKIATVPPGLNQDETAIGYNAYSILVTGRDEWGEKYPLYFKSFGDYKLPIYIYITSLFVKIFGLNEYAVRLPSAVAGTVAVPLLFLLTNLLTRKISLSFFSALLLAITPWHIQFSRSGFEVNFALTAAMLGVFLFILSVTKKNSFLLISSLMAFSICLYSYNQTRLLSPLLLVSVIALNKKKLIAMEPKKLLFALIVFTITLLPFFLSFFSGEGIFSAKSALISSSDTEAKVIELRSYANLLPDLYLKLFYNKYINIAFQYFQNLALLFSGEFFFVKGSPHPNQGIGNAGLLYLFQLPLFIIGVVIFLKNKRKELSVFGLWFLVSIFVLALSKEVPHATRGYFMVIPLTVFSASGLLYFANIIIRRLESDKLRVLILLGAASFIFFNIQFYFISYYFRFPRTSARAWGTVDKDLSLFLSSVNSRYEKIIIDNETTFIYTTFLFYNRYPPLKFINEVVRFKDGDLYKARTWGKYEIRSIDWKVDTAGPNNLIVSVEHHVPKDMPVLKYFYYPTRDVVLSVTGEIVQYPIDEKAYLLVESNSVIGR